MSNQPRVAKVLAALLISMTAGATVLMALSGNPPAAGPFCLSSYYRLDPIEKALLSRAAQSPNRWKCIEIYLSSTKAGNLEQLASLGGLSSPAQLNCHFVVCNGLGGPDGQIQATERWQKQWAVIPTKTWYGSAQTIRVCIVSDGEDMKPTDCQVKRTEALVEKLYRKFSILPDSIYYPSAWR